MEVKKGLRMDYSRPSRDSTALANGYICSAPLDRCRCILAGIYRLIGDRRGMRCRGGRILLGESLVRFHEVGWKVLSATEMIHHEEVWRA